MKTDPIVPNFFIIGAIKSGTTTLANYLTQHPDVFMPGTWEFNYLASDLQWTSSPVARNDAEYLAHFKAGSGKKCIGEKSVFYLYSQEAAKRIYELNPKAKLICILRNPVKLLWSLYKYNISNFEEDILHFEEALAAESDRKTGQRIPHSGTIVQNLFYREIIKFDKQLKTYYDFFPKEQIRIYLFDELKSTPDWLYDDLLQFLDLPHFPMPQKEKYNEGRKVEVYGARSFLNQRPTLKRIWNQVPAPMRKGLKKIMIRLKGQEPKQLAKISPGVEKMLYQETQPMMDRLQALIDKDLSIWQYPAEI